MTQNEQITHLAEQAARGDRNAMSELYTHTCQRTYRTILGLVRDEQTAQDLTQETYISAFTGLSRLEDPARFQPWLISTAVHKSKNHLRSARPLLFSELEDSAAVEDLPDDRAEASPELSLDRAETTRIVRELLGELNESQKLAVELYYYDQLSTAEIAQSLDIPQNTVKTQLHYARKKLEAGLRRLQSKGVELGGLTAAGCFGLLRSLPEEPVLLPREAEAILSRTLAQVPTQVVAKTGRQLLRGTLAKLLLGGLGVAAAGGLIFGGMKLLNREPDMGILQSTQTTLQETEAPEGRVYHYSQDFEDLWTILERDYPFFPFLKSQGTNLENLQSYYRDQVAKVNSPEGYLAVVRRLVDQLKLTGSLRIYSPMELQSAFAYPPDSQVDPDQAVSPEDGDVDPWSALLLDPNLSPLYQQALESIFQGGEAGMYYNALSTPPTVRWYEEEKALLLRFTSCVVPNIPQDREAVAKALAEHPDAEHLIVDLQGNNGGDYSYWAPVLLEPLGGDWSYTARGFYRDTPTTAPFYADLETHPTSELTDAPAWVGELVLDRYYNITMESHSQLPETGLKRWVLTNNQSYSGAAWLAAFCRGTGWAQVIGRPTSTGFGLSVIGAGVVLPDSGLLLQFGDAVETPDGTLDAETGVLPDLICEPNQALNTCLKLIRQG